MKQRKIGRDVSSDFTHASVRDSIILARATRTCPTY